MEYDEHEDKPEWEIAKLRYIGTAQEVLEGDRVIIEFLGILWVGSVVSITFDVEYDESISIAGESVITTSHISDTTIGVAFEDTLDAEQAAPGGYFPLRFFNQVKEGQYPARYVTIKRLVPLP